MADYQTVGNGRSSSDVEAGYGHTQLQSSHDRRKCRITWAVGILIAVIGAGVAVGLLLGSSDDADPYERLRGYCADVPAITHDEFRTRQAAIAQQLTTQGYDAFITEPGATMDYLADMSWSLSERPFLLVIKADGTVEYISPFFERARAEQRMEVSPNPDAEISTWFEDETAYDVLYERLGSPASNYTVAVDPEIRSFITLRSSAVFGPDNSFVDGLEVLRQVRMYKSPAELNILRCANVATKAAIQIVANNIETGQTEAEVSDIMKNAMSLAGLAPRFALVLFGESAAYPHGAAGTIRLEEGEMVLIDAGGKLHGYESDISRTWSHGGASLLSDRQKEIWSVVQQSQEAAFQAIRPGITAGELDDIARQKVFDLGFGSPGNEYEFFKHRLGHGIGLQGHEEPYMVRFNDIVLEPGMTFTVEPGIYIIGELGVRLEDVVRVTEDGYESFGPETLTIETPFLNHELPPGPFENQL